MKEYSEYLQIIKDAISNLRLPEQPAGLYDPIRYTLDCGGKRLRPVLTLAACEAMGKEPMTAIHQAIAIEMFHNFTLLHDDVMDKADVRRGRPTVHIKWNEETAILSGDAMLTTSTMLLAVKAGEQLAQALELFNGTAMNIYEGQQYDMDFESRNDVTVEEYMEMILREEQDTTLCYLDLDGLKYVNDTFGHLEGDIYIQNFVELIKANFRSEDTFARIGGDEFCLVLSGSIKELIDLKMAEILKDFQTGGYAEYQCSFSYGIVGIDGANNDLSYDDILHEADGIMYECKRRNKEKYPQLVR